MLRPVPTSVDGNMSQENKMGINSETFQREKDTAVSPDLKKKTKKTNEISS